MGCMCTLSDVRSPHPAEDPHLFYCRNCYAQRHPGHPPLRPNKKRDAGICVSCDKPSELNGRAVWSGPVLAREAEIRGITVARLATKKYCAECSPYSLPMCRAIKCPSCEPGRRARSIRCIHSRNPKNTAAPHCQAECDRKRAARAAADARYRKSPEGKAARAAAGARYRKSPEGKAARARYEKSPEGKATRARYRKSPEGKAARAAADARYRKSPEGKAARAAADAKYRKSPEGKATRARYRKAQKARQRGPGT